MSSTFVVENPKRRVSAKKWSAGWYNYYAGFSADFAKVVLESSNLSPGSIIADPWNGSGTTTEIASLLGFTGHGFDLNPVMMIVATARMLGRRTKPSITPLTLRILHRTKSKIATISGDDSLGWWFNSSGIDAIRRLESAIQELVIDSDSYKILQKRNIAEEVSDIAAFFYNALFRSVRRLISPFLGSNPTWVRRAKNDEEKISLDLALLTAEFRRQVRGMLEALDDVLFCHLDADYSLGIASSNNLPLGNGSVDMVLTSPPYCTRIDYAIATLPELAILGFSKTQLRELREGLIGTATISRTMLDPKEEWGNACNKLLRMMKRHTSKASATYYYKNHLQYFNGIFESLGECNRILKPDGTCVLVVQDSYYKNLHNDLPKIIIEMSEANGLTLDKRYNFSQSQTLAGVNPAVKEYRKTFGATCNGSASIAVLH